MFSPVPVAQQDTPDVWHRITAVHEIVLACGSQLPERCFCGATVLNTRWRITAIR